MPVDLDELFTALGRQSDALPLAAAAVARRRGDRRRTRHRAVLATTAAVVLILAGVGVVSVRHRDAAPTLPATTPSRIRGMAPAGEPLKPPAGQTFTAARISGTRVIGYTGSEVVAVDTTTGRTLWTRPGLDRTYRGVATTPSTVMLLRELSQQSETSNDPGERILEFHDPATGAQRWELRHTTDDTLVVHQDTLVRLDGRTGRIAAYNLVDGKPRWSAAAGASLISGMRTAADAFEGTSGGLYDPTSEKVFPYGDDRLVSITAKGRVQIRDVHTGKVRSSVQARPQAQGLFAYEGTVYTEETVAEYRGIGTPARILYQRHDPWAMETSFPCGHERLCVYESAGEQEMRLVQIDAATGAVLRTTGAVPLYGTSGVRLGHVMTSGGGDKGTALYDENGQARYSDNGIGGFVDDGNALTLTRDAGDGRFTVRGVSNIDFRKVELGTMPEISGRCDWNEALLTCPTGEGIFTWRFAR